MFGFKWLLLVVIGHGVFCLVFFPSPCSSSTNGSTEHFPAFDLGTTASSSSSSSSVYVSVSSSPSDGDQQMECPCGPRPCPLNSTTPPSLVCHPNRTVNLTEDCPCCPHVICAERQVNQSCDHRLLLCDPHLGLRCHNDTFTCYGPFNLHALKVTHNSSVLHWTESVGDGEAAYNLSLSMARQSDVEHVEPKWTALALNHSEASRGRAAIDGLEPNSSYHLRLIDDRGNSEGVIVQTQVGCVANGTSYGVGERYDVGCRERCVCSDGGVSECSDACEARGSGGSCREVGPDPTNPCCSLFVCEDGRAHVILTGRTPDSLTFAWDDFKVPGPNLEYGYVVEFRRYTIDNVSFSPWNKIQVGDVPITTLRNLKPNTPYEVRVSVWEDVVSKRLGPSAEVTVLHTEDGCVWNNRSVAVGDVYDRGCEARCFCLGNDTSECGSRCTGSHRPKGYNIPGSNCTENAVEGDVCCVRVECVEDRHLPLDSHDGHVDGEERNRGECPVTVTDTTRSCVSTCKSDEDCEIGTNCCLSDCGNTVCIASVPLTIVSSQLSSKTKAVKAGCTFGNATYLVGETFNSGCDYKCHCNNNEGKYEMSCQPRCSRKEDKSRLFDRACRSVRDPNDECCRVLVCETTSENDAEQNPDSTKNAAIRERFPIGNFTDLLVKQSTLKQAKDVAVDESVFARGTVSENVTEDDGLENETPTTSFEGTSSVAPTNESGHGRDSRFEGRQMASIYKILPINPTTVRLQILMSPLVMEKMFMDDDAVAVLYTNNLTTDLAIWDRHPLALQHNVALVSVDRSDVAVETLVTELLPNREYYFVTGVLNKRNDPEVGLRYGKLGEVQGTVTVQLEESECEFMGKTFRMGERLYDDCQAMCDCLPGRHVHCEAIVCPNQLSSEKSGCLEWHADQSFIPRAPHCCPDVGCKYGSTCVFEGRKFRNLESLPRFLVDDCDQECKCIAGNVTCTPRCPPLAPDPPTDLGCKPTLSLIQGDDCCLHWHCDKDVENETGSESPDLAAPSTSTTISPVEGTNRTITTGDGGTHDVGFAAVGLVSNDTVHEVTDKNVLNSTEASLLLLQSDCLYENGTYRVNEQWRVGKGHRQKTCTCIALSNGSSSVECQGGCPPILKQHLGLIPDCPPENVVVWDVPELCPYVVCNKTDIGRGVKNVTVEPLNSTSVRVNFVIPNIYVGLYGHIEILYTMDLTHGEDTTTWNKEVFSGPSNQFENARLAHEMNGLQPDTEYYLKVHVIIKNTKNMETSDIFTVHTPPLPTTASTVVATTLPPKISIDPRMNVSDVQSTSAKISWRSFEESERRFIDGVQLQYRPQSDSTFHQWSQTMLIHRDVTTYVLDGLKPDTVYDAVLVFVPPANVSTEVLSEKSVPFRTLLVRDDFEFNLTLTVDRVTAHSVDLIWTGVPYPEQKYVNVYRISCVELRGRNGVEPSQLFRTPKGNQFQSTVDGLISETNYTIWMQVYLINGKVRTSNNLTFATKSGSALSKTTEKEKLEAVGDSSGNYAKAGVASPTYYAAMIVAAVVAILSSIGFVILLFVLLRKQSSAKAPITSTKSHSAYDNPTYKKFDQLLEQQKEIEDKLQELEASPPSYDERLKKKNRVSNK